MTRCPICIGPTITRNDRVHLAHLTWCPRAPRPPRPTPQPAPPPPTAAELEAEAQRVIDELTARARAVEDDADQRRLAATRRATNETRARLHELGTTHADVRRWAVTQGLTTQDRGTVSRNLIETYADAHPDREPRS